MTGRRLSAILALLALFAAHAPLCAYTIQYASATGLVARRWLTQPIIISLSTSLASPPPNIKAGSDVIGAVRRALRHWSSISNVQFFETSSAVQTISPASAGDHVNLITVSGDNAAAFNSQDIPGRTRVFSDASGAITEADIALNPNVLFSTDGTVGTYDLESTFTHEIGHLLGLEHSAILGATMQPRQATNGLFGLPAFTQRSLSDDDIAGARALYGSRAGTGSVSGRLVATGGQAGPVFGAHVFAEEVSTGRVIAGSISLHSGDYRIDGLPAGGYRVIGQGLDGLIEPEEIATARGSYAGLVETTPPFRTQIANWAATQLIPVAADKGTSVGFFVSSNPPLLAPHLIGMNGELSTVALPLTPGKKVRIYIAGEGIDDVPAAGISSTSPFISVDSESVNEEQFDTPYPAISFEITVARNTPAGEYSILLQSADGEIAYLVGA
ncbi:MAG TPA: matrixin family metalloprotease, partial [Pyrinomonadaceae bacterium]|nr:matrixin family metalloprotease [Pyrinomonadaceae bacterium]